MFVRIMYGIMIFFLSLEILARTMQKIVSLDYIEEKVSGQVFVYRKESIDGLIKETWAIDGKKVEKVVYDESILAADVKERAYEREKEYEEIQKKRIFQHAASRNLYIKLLQAIADELQEIIMLFQSYQLVSYIKTPCAGIKTQEEFYTIMDETLPGLRLLLKDEQVEYTVLRDRYESCKEIPVLLTECFYETVHHAIETVDDTKQLKRLLALVTQEL